MSSAATREEEEEQAVGLYPRIGRADAPHKILYINPNSTEDMSDEAAEYFKDKLAPDVHVTFYTATPDAPPSIDGTLDGVISTAAVLQDLGLFAPRAEDRRSDIQHTSTAIIVGCFSAHPLLPALQEALRSFPPAPPVIGIMEAAIYTALQLAPSFGIVTTGRSELHSRSFLSQEATKTLFYNLCFSDWEPLFATHLRTMGVAESRVAGVKGTGYNAIGLHGSDVSRTILSAAEELVDKGAGAIVLGCAVSIFLCIFFPHQRHIVSSMSSEGGTDSTCD